ncbi:T9SS type A sorting domain-containing protein [Winogradskyella sp.]|uniref:T9SS type A sorting domain-containing protein n=1 Tax=Winogradskyella sp. TaxID=1883156 RepID=UPI00261C0C50|nr:T9SS type A sorting domain-containing protein [Winogradskyella sp.]
MAFVFLLANTLKADNDKYRIILVDDPATTITIAWNQISGTNPVVHYGTTDEGTVFANYPFSQSVDRTEVYRGMDNRFVRLTGLLPDTAYYFVINDSEGTSNRYWFKTAPNDNSRLSFIAGGDSRNNRTPRQNANKLVAKLKPHAVLFGGDMTDDDTNSEWQDWFDDWQFTIAADGRMFPIVPARGNHEYDPVVVYNLFDTPNTDSYFALTFGQNLVRAYTLNTEISILGNQLTWLQNDLATNSSTHIWNMAQYHKPMRPHTAFKSEGRPFQYESWAQLFYDNDVRLVIDCDSHMTKTTWPVRPSLEAGNDEGFEIDVANGTVYAGEGAWGAPLRPNDDDKSWTRNSGSFNQFKLIFIDTQEIHLRTIQVDNADSVGEVSNDDPFILPANLDVFSPPTGDLVIITNNDTNNPCNIVGTACDDGDSMTSFDEEDGFCNCEGVLDTDLMVETIDVDSSSDDAEEDVPTGVIDLTSTDLELIQDGSSEQVVGIRFNNIQIPDGSTLYRAYIQFTTDETNAGFEPTMLDIYGELSPNSSTFLDVAFDISSRAKTNSFVTWDEIPLWDTVGEADINQRTPYLTPIVSEIINQVDWQVGNSMTFIFSGTGQRIAEAFDGSAPPQLKLFYQPPCPDAGTACDDGDPNTTLDVEDGECNCVGLPANGTLTFAVQQSSDDAEEAETGGAMYLDSSDLEMVFDSFAGQNNQHVGIRFANVTIPQGANIVEAYIQFTVDETDSEQTDLTIHGELIGNSPTFTLTDFDITNRTTTTASVDWNNVPAWTNVNDEGDDQKTPDLSTIVQEIVDQPTWSIFNGMSFIITGSGSRAAESYNGEPDSAPRLVINYTTQTFNNDAGLIVSNIFEQVCGNDIQPLFQIENLGLDPITTAELTYQINGSAPVVINWNGNLLPGETANLGNPVITIDDGVNTLTASITSVNGVSDEFPENSTFSTSFSKAPNYVTTEIDLSLTFDDYASETSWIFEDENGVVIAQGESYDDSFNNTTITETFNVNSDTCYTFTVFDAYGDGFCCDYGIGAYTLSLDDGTVIKEGGDFGNSESTYMRIVDSISCPVVGTPCNDGNPDTIYDESDGSCGCSGIPNDAVENNLAVLNNDDDAEETISTGSVDLSSSDLELIWDNEDQVVGIRFDDVQIPDGSILYRAYLQFQTDEDASDQDPTNLLIHGELSPNSNMFTSTNFDISSRVLTNTSIPWNDIGLWDNVGEAGLLQRTPYVTDIVQEVIGQQDWSQGNPITFIISGSGKRVAEARDGSAAPILKLFYFTPCQPSGTPCDDGDANTLFDIEDGNCNCAGIPETGTLTYQVNASNNDAEEEVANGDMSIGSSDLELVDESGSTNQLVGIRFTNIHLPAGADITNAYIQFTVDDDNTGQTDLEIRAEANANSLEFTLTDFDISSRTTSTNMVPWNNVPAWNTADVGTAGPDQRTPNISVLLEEILGQAGWDLLNPVTFIINGSGEREAESFDGTAAPQLVIEYDLSALSITDNDLDQNSVTLYPNPAKDLLYIGTNMPYESIAIYDINGRLVKTIKSDISNEGIDVNLFESGVYFVRINFENNQIVKKFIKR